MKMVWAMPDVRVEFADILIWSLPKRRMTSLNRVKYDGPAVSKELVLKVAAWYEDLLEEYKL